MAHFARIDENGFVVDMHVVKNCAIGGCIGENHPEYIENPDIHIDCGSLDFPDTEPIGQKFLSSLHGYPESNFIQCSYNSNFRGIYPGFKCFWNGTEFIST